MGKKKPMPNKQGEFQALCMKRVEEDEGSSIGESAPKNSGLMMSLLVCFT
jgi:hypothetical protein